MARADTPTIRYFVTFTADHGQRCGNAEVRLTHPIRSGADIKVVTQILTRSGCRNPVVLGWQRFEQ
ncbi:hypothetical protein QTQ03_17625 [Micromonospora sp. WMMA1363]|uniref:hypothetical protein n=1 Tax=Micromonospora sp. WMMA1363 TaxID=3053985 RepID=UPI00259CB447|nr:hypothetical protein [Micromonospora sp. WMMA1363]MDM4721334.1 hypothetical protein [Micromonospora sp. WMMA1363]